MDREEVDRRDLPGVVLEEGAPGLRKKDLIGANKGTPVLLRFRLDLAKLFWIDFD